jgi:hypothetical protein
MFETFCQLGFILGLVTLTLLFAQEWQRWRRQRRPLPFRPPLSVHASQAIGWRLAEPSEN